MVSAGLGRASSPSVNALGGRSVWQSLRLGALLTGFSAAQAAELEWTDREGYRSAPLKMPASQRVGFRRMSEAETGIYFANVLAEARSLTNHILLNGSGVALGDVDGDGRSDVYLCGLDNENKLYRNLGGWRFEDVTAQAGVGCPGQDSTGAAFADLDGDNDLDLLINSVGGGTRCFLNDGRALFKEITAEAGLNTHSGATSLALADVDGNGALDLYVVNYRSSTIRDTFQSKIRVGSVNGRRVITRFNDRPTTGPDLVGRFSIDENGGLIENGEADALYLNDGKARFSVVPFTNGAFLDETGAPLSSSPYDWGLTAQFRDLNGDSAPDLYVCNDFASPDRIWINDGRGHFRALRGLAVRKQPWFSMGVDFADVNRDGYDDFFVSDMLSRDHVMRHTQENDHRSILPPRDVIDNRPQYVRSMLFLNQGDGDYTEIACFSGLEASDWSWSPAFLDVDLDGYEDLLLTTGFERNVQDRDIALALEQLRRTQAMSDHEALMQRRRFPRLAQANLAYRNQRDLRFEEVGGRWGFGIVGVSQAMALADLDQDGDLDVVINNLNEGVILLQNVASAPRLAVRLRGKSPNTRGIGARIKATLAPSLIAGERAPLPGQSQEMECGGRYLAADDSLRVFAAGHPTNVFTIEVTWRSGARSVIRGEANHLYEINETRAEPAQSPRGELVPVDQAKPIFQDISHLISHRHTEDEFDDFERQPLLPKRLGQLGPGVGWVDLNGDGWDDLIIGGGRGSRLAVFHNDGRGGFTAKPEAEPSTVAVADHTGIVGWPAELGTNVLLTGNSNYEDGATNRAFVKAVGNPAGVGLEEMIGFESSPGPLALADLDGSGVLVLFVGGRVIAGRYPEPASSRIYRRTNGRWELDVSNTRRLEQAGMVSGSVFSDLTGDGLPELILACEWGPLKIFRNERGQLLPWSIPVSTNGPSPIEITQLTGWWNGVTTVDLDEDGRLDIIASNWGRNTKYETHRHHALALYFGDFDQDGRTQMIEAYFDSRRGKMVPWATWDRLGASFLAVRAKFGSFRQYAEASVAEILGEQFKSAKILQAVWLESTLFLNRGDHFEAQPLPWEAQLAPAFAVCAADIDGDGHEDVYLSQNFLGTDARTARYDSGRGLWLRGDGSGGLKPMPATQSGVRIYGEQRGAAVSDFDGDGRLDLVAAQNNGETKLYRNAHARPGLAVRLIGPSANREGIGAALRLIAAGRAGPVKEIHAGSGYWSQDSTRCVLTSTSPLEQLWVRWPGGRTNVVKISAEAREITLDYNGLMTILR